MIRFLLGACMMQIQSVTVHVYPMRVPNPLYLLVKIKVEYSGLKISVRGNDILISIYIIAMTIPKEKSL